MDPELWGSPYDEPASDEELQGGAFTNPATGKKQPTLTSILKRIALELAEMNRPPSQ